MPRNGRDYDWLVNDATWMLQPDVLGPNQQAFGHMNDPTPYDVNTAFGIQQSAQFQINDDMVLERVRGQIILGLDPSEFTDTLEFRLYAACDIFDWDYVNAVADVPSGYDLTQASVVNRSLLWLWTDLNHIEAGGGWGDQLAFNAWWIYKRIEVDIKVRRRVQAHQTVNLILQYDNPPGNGPRFTYTFQVRSLWSRPT